jgi:alkylation response protein AidB-like acyl-CoA dehydrogenase
VARRIAQEKIAPSAEHHDATGEFPMANMKLLGENGLMGVEVPAEYGGAGMDPISYVLAMIEVAAADAAHSTIMSVNNSLFCNGILKFGTEEQKEKYALPTLRAEIAWCIGMSEPGAGSDLAGLSTRAVVDGDTFVVNGQKVWTSGAHHADWCICYVRTDPNAPKHKGISALIIDMKTPGITCRPLPELTDPQYADLSLAMRTEVRAGEVFDALGRIIKRELGKKGPGLFVVPGLMKINLIQKPATKARKGINPFTKEEVMFKAKPARRVVKIRPLKNLKDMVK